MKVMIVFVSVKDRVTIFIKPISFWSGKKIYHYAHIKPAHCAGRSHVDFVTPQAHRVWPNRNIIVQQTPLAYVHSHLEKMINPNCSKNPFKPHLFHSMWDIIIILLQNLMAHLLII